MTNLTRLYQEQRQSPWLDNLQRSYLTSGRLGELRDKGIRGVTSNPTIFQKAIASSADYDEQFRSLLQRETVENAYWEMVISDIEGALDVFAPVHRDSGGEDGFVSLELSPTMANDSGASERAARSFHERIARPNLYVKIPATAAGIPAVRVMVAEGRNINITLIFSLERYAEVIEAYLSGLEEFVAGGGDPSGVRSVASFFVSRVDTDAERRLEVRDAELVYTQAEEASALRGKLAVAQAKLAYELFRERFSGPRWDALAGRGANLQRPLWASTSTKNKAYPDLLYVDNLMGPDTVNTMPDATIDAFLDHGTLGRTIDAGAGEARRDMDRAGELGVDMADVSRVLEEEGVASFSKSFEELIQSLTDKANALAR
jgi:transaldolase